MITLNNISKQFGETNALVNITFFAKRGEIIGFLGPNGAGKTTTMRVILGLIKPTAGVVKIDADDPILERLVTLPKIGYLPENNPLYPEMKVIEYLTFVSGMKNEKSLDNLEKIMFQVDILDKKHSNIDQLSRGYKQRVGLAAALIGDPYILILDEPTSGLDPIEQDKIKKLIKSISKEKTVIFSTHILSEVEDIASRLIIVDKGSIIYDGNKPKQKGGVEKLFKKLINKSTK